MKDKESAAQLAETLAEPTETPETLAEPTETPETLAEPTESIPRSEASVARTKRMAALFKGIESSATRDRLLIGLEMATDIAENVVACAKSLDAIDGIRKQSFNIQSFEVSKESTLTISAKHIEEALKAYHLLEALPKASQKRFRRLTYANIRVLIRWIVRDGKEPFFDPGESYLETWNVKDGCFDRLVELVEAYAVLSRSPNDVRKALDEHEASLDKARLDEMDGSARMRELASRATLAKAQLNKDKDAFFASILTKASSLKIGPDELSAEMKRRDIVQPTSGDFNAATLTADEATQLAKDIVAADNLDAIGAMTKVFLPIAIATDTNKQPSRATGQTLGMSRKIA